MTVEWVRYQIGVRIEQSLSLLSLPAADDVEETVISGSDWNTATLLKSTTTPAVSKVAYFRKGTGTIDLTSLTGSDGQALSFSGLKVRAAKVRNPTTNTGRITFYGTASNPGYPMLNVVYEGSDQGFLMVLVPGQEVTMYLASSAPTVSSTVKDMVVTAAVTGEKLDVALAAG